MTKHIKPFKLTRRMKTRLESMYHSTLKCHHKNCGIELKVGDDIICRRRTGGGKRGGNNQRTVRYHKECWEALFF